MTRFSRINTIWRKELRDTLRDRRTVMAMVIVPIILYPALMLGSLQAFELQSTSMEQEVYIIAVADEQVAHWLRARIDADLTRHPAGVDVAAEDLPELRQEMRENPTAEAAPPPDVIASNDEAADADARSRPPDFRILITKNVRETVKSGAAHVGILVDGPLPTFDSGPQSHVTLVYDQTEYRSYRYAAPGLQGILSRLQAKMVEVRLTQHGLDPSVLSPLDIKVDLVATPERVGGSILGQIVPFILIVMTISGAIYPAIDLTAGERERGTLETLMVAPVPTVDLIAGKFIVVTLIGMLSATLNLLSVAGTVYLGGLGDILAKGGEVVFPLAAMPWVLIVLIPLAVMFSAALLAVCSFARSFKEAQNYVMPVMVAAMIPAVVGTLPGSRLEGPLLVIPVANIVLLTRDLFMGRIDALNILWVTMSSSIYAGAAVAVAAKLFGQEAVLFADSGSIKSLFVRRFFKARAVPTAAMAFLVLAVAYLLHFFISQTLLGVELLAQPVRYLSGLVLLLTGLLGLFPYMAAVYTRVRPLTAFALHKPRVAGLLAALCFGCSTWLLTAAWLSFQAGWMPIPPEAEVGHAQIQQMISAAPLWLVLVALAFTPGFVEELFFRGYVLQGLRGSLGKWAALLITAFAFAMFHHSVYRLIVTGALGLLFGLLVLRGGSIWPAVIAHMMHNAMLILLSEVPALETALADAGVIGAEDGAVSPIWTAAALGLTVVGVLLVFSMHPSPGRPKTEPMPSPVPAD